MESVDQDPPFMAGSVGPESGGLGFPNIADRIEYSKFAASDPKLKFASKGRLKTGSSGGNGSAA